MKLFKKWKKSLRHSLPLHVAIVLVACLTIGGTWAFLQEDTGIVTNSFSSGGIEYTLTLNANADYVDKDADDVNMPGHLTPVNSTDLSVTFTADKDPELTGYTFEGWYYDKACSLPYVDVVDKSFTVKYGDEHDSDADANKVNITLFAKWEPIEYTVRYDRNEATAGETAGSSHVYDVAKKLSTNGYSRIGYEFLGWSTDPNASAAKYSDGQEVVNLTANEGEEVVLYAVWSPLNYTVSFDAQAENVADLADIEVTYDEPYRNLHKKVVRKGYTFIGWTLSPNGTDFVSDETIVKIAEDHTLYAQWGVKSYTIIYHANGGEGTMANQVIEYDKLTPLSKNAFTMEGDYSFTGWAETPEGEVKYIDNQQVVNLLESGELHLYAVWKRNTYTATFDYNIGYGTPPTKQVIYGEEYGVLPPYLTTETENLFKGWYTAPEGGERVYPSTIVNLKEDHTLWAHWEPSPANDIIQDLVVHSSADDDNDGLVDDIHLEFKCSSYFEKFNIPLKNLVPGQKYKLTYTASNNASFGDHINGYKNSRYGSYIVEEATESAGNIDDAVASDIIATWNDRIELDGINDGSHAAINDEWLNGPWKERTIEFTATAENMYWAWEFGLIEDGIRYDYNMFDMSLEPVEPEIKFGNKTVLKPGTSNAKIVSWNSGDYNVDFTFDGDGGCETLYYPITGLTAGTTYTIEFEHLFTGNLIDDTATYTGTPRYDYGCGIMNTKPADTAMGGKMSSLGTWASNIFVMPSSTGNTDNVTLTFKATGTTAYWVWNMANCSDSTNATINIKVKEFKAQHAGGGSITYYPN